METINMVIINTRRYLDFKSSILHCSFMVTYVYWKYKKKVNQRKTFTIKVKSRILTIKIGVIFLYKNLFYLTLLYFTLNAKFQPLGS